MGRSENFSFELENSLPGDHRRPDALVPELLRRATAGDASPSAVAAKASGQDVGTVTLARNSEERAALPELQIVHARESKRAESGETQFVRADLPARFGANVELDEHKRIAKITYPAEGKTREFGRDENGEINRLVTTTPRGQYSYVKEDGQWLYLAPGNKRAVAPDFSLDSNGEFSKAVRDGVVLTQRADGRSFEEERTAIGARIQRNADGNPTVIKRPDNTMISATYENGQLTKLVDSADGQSTVWKLDARGNWRSDDVPPQTVRNLRIENNGNLSYAVDNVKYTIRGNGAEIVEGPGRAKYDFDDQGRISKIRYPGNKSSLSFGYMGPGNEPSFVQVDDFEKHSSKRYIHQAEKGGWTELDRNNNMLGTWQGTVKLNDDGTYSVKPTDGAQVTYLADGSVRRQQNREHVRPDTRPDNPQERRPDTQQPESKHPDTRHPDRRRPEDRRPHTQRPEDRRPDTQKPGEHRPDAQTPTEPGNINEVTDHSVQLRGYMLPSPDQLGAGSCLYMSATGIAEYLINKSKGIVNPQVGGATDLSEQWTINLSKTVQLGNNYTDAPELLARAGALPDSRMKFKAYGSSSWMNEAAIGGRGTETLPPYKKDVLFNGGGEGSQNAYGQMRPADLERIKKYLREQQSPVLFVYKPPTANWWHANIITGYDDKKQTFTVRDSSFGRQVTNAPSYNYDGRSPWGARPYRDQTEMPYYQVMQWGNHATGYRLAGS